MQKPTANVDEYIASFPPEIQVLLKQMRQTIREAAPDATELISYGMPGYKLNGSLVWFAAAKNHIGFYPSTSGVKFFVEKYGNLKSSKGAIQIPMDKPLPLDMVADIVRLRVEENLAKAQTKKK
ncbi:MAG: DUF1801 domain-containing protein [Saprospiraceae bacterium]|nr:DUF1801 domain-containing protein [Saprospiraceae bacterium]